MNSLMCGRVLFLATLCLQVFLLPTSVIYRLATKCVRCACDWRPVTSAMVWVCLVQLLSIRRRSSTSSAHRLKPFSPLSSAEVQIRAGRFFYKKMKYLRKCGQMTGPLFSFKEISATRRRRISCRMSSISYVSAILFKKKSKNTNGNEWSAGSKQVDRREKRSILTCGTFRIVNIQKNSDTRRNQRHQRFLRGRVECWNIVTCVVQVEHFIV